MHDQCILPSIAYICKRKGGVSSFLPSNGGVEVLADVLSTWRSSAMGRENLEGEEPEGEGPGREGRGQRLHAAVKHDLNTFFGERVYLIRGKSIFRNISLFTITSLLQRKAYKPAIQTIQTHMYTYSHDDPLPNI